MSILILAEQADYGLEFVDEIESRPRDHDHLLHSNYPADEYSRLVIVDLVAKTVVEYQRDEPKWREQS